MVIIFHSLGRTPKSIEEQPASAVDAVCCFCPPFVPLYSPASGDPHPWWSQSSVPGVGRSPGTRGRRLVEGPELVEAPRGLVEHPQAQVVDGIREIGIYIILYTQKTIKKQMQTDKNSIYITCGSCVQSTLNPLQWVARLAPIARTAASSAKSLGSSLRGFLPCKPKANKEKAGPARLHNHDSEVRMFYLLLDGTSAGHDLCTKTETSGEDRPHSAHQALLRHNVQFSALRSKGPPAECWEWSCLPAHSRWMQQ